VQYIDNIASATSLPGSPPFDPNVGQPSENNNPLDAMYGLKLSDSIDNGK